MKKFLSLALALLTVFSLCACGSSSDKAVTEEACTSEAYLECPEMENGLGFAEMDAPEGPAAEPDDAGPDTPEVDPEKIIYSADITLESTDFDGCREKLMALVSEYGGYIESSSLSDADYYSKMHGGRYMRSASYVLRIPGTEFTQMSSDLSQLGNVPYSRTYTENVSAQYYDTEARLRAYTAQEERLLEMLEAAESVEDILAIEGQLTNVRYEIESLQSSLKNWDRRISYSTIYLELQEVSEYTDEPAPSLNFGQRLVRSLKNGFRGVGHFFQNLLIWLAGALPALVIIAVLIIVLRPLFKKQRARHRAKKALKEQNKSDK